MERKMIGFLVIVAIKLQLAEIQRANPIRIRRYLPGTDLRCMLIPQAKVNASVSGNLEPERGIECIMIQEDKSTFLSRNTLICKGFHALPKLLNQVLVQHCSNSFRNLKRRSLVAVCMLHIGLADRIGPLSDSVGSIVLHV